MADRPLEAALPADLPENWTSGQIVAPSGADAGLSEQHGYNYLMAQVNAAQRAANAINESFDTISGKRTCRFVVGTSTAGWTAADCDYLCDGVDDQVEIQAAVDAAPSGGCEIVLLDGAYNLGGVLNINKSNIWIHGNGDSTKLKRTTTEGESTANYIIALYPGTLMTDLYYDGNNSGSLENTFEIVLMGGSLKNITFFNTGYGCIAIQGTAYTKDVSRVVGCNGLSSTTYVFVRIMGNGVHAVIMNNNTPGPLYLLDNLLGAQNTPSSILVYGNSALLHPGSIKLDTRDLAGTNFFIISNNYLRKLDIDSSAANPANQRNGAIVFGNAFLGESDVAISLSANTRNNFVFGNYLYKYGSPSSMLAIDDQGKNNIILGNSNDTGSGSGGGGTAGVSSFKGRSGAVTPQAGDYTAAMVGARPDTWTPTASDVGAIPAGSVASIQSLTQAEYDALSTKNAAALYLIEG